MNRHILFLISLPLLFGWISSSEGVSQTVQSKSLLPFPIPQKENALQYGTLQDLYPYNPHVPLEVWDAVKPYFFPTNHPLKRSLDELFSNTRVTLSPETFKKAGFHVRVRKIDNIFASKHKKLKGLIVKAYLDTQPVHDDWALWLQREHGAELIRQCIKRYGYEHLCAVPTKWIYPLPLDPSPPSNSTYIRKNFILIAEDMRILSRERNADTYRYYITEEHLDALYVILTEAGLIDSIYISNIPFNKDGKIVFIDTEHYGKGPIRYEELFRRLSPKMQLYWESLILNGGPRKKS